MIQVHLGAVFRIAREDLLNFEARLRVEEKMKASFFNMGILRQRADVLLEQSGQARFNFPDLTMPDESWFIRALRFIDPYNILQALRIMIHDSLLPRSDAGRV